jgi:hypothetical protein
MGFLLTFSSTEGEAKSSSSIAWNLLLACFHHYEARPRSEELFSFQRNILTYRKVMVEYVIELQDYPCVDGVKIYAASRHTRYTA